MSSALLQRFEANNPKTESPSSIPIKTASYANDPAMSSTSDNQTNKRKHLHSGLAVKSKKVALSSSTTKPRPMPAKRTLPSGPELWDDSTSSLLDYESLSSIEKSTPLARTYRLFEPNLVSSTLTRGLPLTSDTRERNSMEQTRLKADNDRLQAQNNPFKANNDRIRAENDRIITESARIKAESERLKTDNKILKTENASLKTTNISFNDKVTSLTAENTSLKATEAHIKTSTTEKDRMASLTTENTLLGEQNRALVQEKADVVKANIRLRDQNQKLENEVKEEIKAFEGYKKRVRALGNEFRQS